MMKYGVKNLGSEKVNGDGIFQGEGLWYGIYDGYSKRFGTDMLNDAFGLAEYLANKGISTWSPVVYEKQ